MEPLALKKFDNFKRFVSIYPEFKHVFVCDNGQGDVRAGELMFDAFPKHLEAVYVHRVKEIHKTHGYDGDRYMRKSYAPYFFRTYADAALHAATREPPLIKLEGMRRICEDAVNDFYAMSTKEWISMKQKAERRDDLNQDIWKVNEYLEELGEEPVAPVEAERLWKDGERVRTPYGIGVISSFDSGFDLYEVELDWRPVDVQIDDHKKQDAKARKKGAESPSSLLSRSRRNSDGDGPTVLETVVEATDENDDEGSEANPLDGSNVFQSSIRDQLERVSEHVDEDEDDEDSSAPSTIVRTPSILSEESSIVSAGFPSDSLSIDTNIALQETEDATSTGDLDTPTSIVNSPRSMPSKAKPGASFSRPVMAKVQGKLIRKYSPPKPPALPKEDKTRQSIFSFWADETKKSEPFTLGDKCTTPYGPATVIEYRKGKGIVVVEMIGWKAKAYLQKRDVKKIVSEGIWNSLMRTLYSSEGKDVAAASEPKQKERGLEFPHAIGTILQTPYGEGVVSRPLPISVASSPPRLPPGSAPSTPKRTTLAPKDGTTGSEITPTLEVTLTMWHLANESSAKLYCTVEQARNWKKAHDNKSKSGDGVLTVVGGLLSRGLKRMASSVDKTPKKSQTPPAQIEETPARPKFQRYYQNGASVTTSFGDGLVQSFRESDGFYEIKLEKWTGAVAYLRRDDLSYRLAESCHEGYPVLTRLGLSGTLESVQPKTGVHVVTIPATNMVCYLQPKDVVRPLKAAKSEDVATPYGEGIMLKYRLEDDMYEIKLKAFGNATLFCRAETFDRIADTRGEEGSSGLSWFLRYLFFSSDGTAAAPAPAPASSSHSRSRSNSIVSARSGSTSTSKAK